MPPKKYSRYEFTLAIRDDNDVLHLTDREPFRFKDFDDNRTHVVEEGDTIFTLAGAYFRPWDRACGFFWVICDFQPDPIIDPTLKLDLGRIIYIPSLRTLDEEILSEDRRRFH